MEKTLEQRIKEYAEANGLSPQDKIWKDVTTMKGLVHQWLFTLEGVDYYLIPQNMQKIWQHLNKKS